MSQPLFGLIPAGQPMLITPTQSPTPTSFLYAIPPSPTKPFSHIVVVLLPGVSLPPATAAAIYLVTPPTAPGQTEPDSKFLGGIGPGKESAIFKLNPATAAAGGAGGNVVIGVSVEPADSVAARITTTPSTAATTTAAATTAASANTAGGALVPAGQQPSTLVLAQRIIKNAFNFLASFSGTTTAAGPGGGQVEVVPLKAFEEWWRKFEGRVRSDPGFLERDD